MLCSGSMVADDRSNLLEGEFYGSHSDITVLDIDGRIDGLARNVHRVNSAIFVETSNENGAENEKKYLTATDFYDVLSRWENRSETDSEQRPEIRFVNSAIFVESLSNSDEDLRRIASDEPVVATRSCVVDSVELNTRDCCSGFRRESETRRVPELKLPESTVTSFCTLIDDPKKSRSGTFDEWYAMKELEKLKRERETLRMREMEREEKERRLIRQREDFKRWLKMKKQDEAKSKLERELLTEKQKLIEQIREKKTEQSIVAYNNWLRMKEAQNKDKKRIEEDRQRCEREEIAIRKQRSETAFRQWLAKAKTTPKPVPLNRGIETLRGSVSAMYINPTPWEENTNRLEC